MNASRHDSTASQIHRLLARRARLKYQLDSVPGIQRRRAGKGFRYLSSNGPLTNTDRDRILRLVIPPAWAKVWISPLENGHLQVTGFDARGRKQYRYHARWTEVVNRAKFDRLVEIGRVLARLRRRVSKDLKEPLLSKQRVTALVVRLLDLTAARVGSQEYFKDNDTHGLTTLLDRQVRLSGDRLEFRFRGKSGVRHEFALQNASLAALIKQCRDLPGRFVFQYETANGCQPVHADDVNAYLAEATGGVMTAKDFRTWRGSVFVATCLMNGEMPRRASDLKRRVMGALRDTASLLGNTVTVCRKYYVHQSLIETYLDSRFEGIMRQFATGGPRGLSRDEQRFLHFLKRLG